MSPPLIWHCVGSLLCHQELRVFMLIGTPLFLQSHERVPAESRSVRERIMPMKKKRFL